MEIVRLKIENFLAIGSAPAINLSNQGLVLIQGVNLDDTSAISNGVGKSSMVDALCWAIYGQTARGETGDGAVNNTAKKDCVVGVIIEDGSTSYGITRYRKHTYGKNQTIVTTWSGSSTPVDISKGTEKETQALIEEIMGCSLDVFKAAIYAGQENTPDLPGMTDKALKLLLEEAAGVEQLEKAYEIARSKMNTLSATYEASHQKALVAVDFLSVRERDVIDAKQKEVAFDGERQDISDLHQSQAKEKGKAILELRTQLKKMPDKAVLKAKIAELNDSVAMLKEEKKRAEELRSIAGQIGTEYSNENTRLGIALNEIKKLKYTHDNAEMEMLKPCKSCGKPHELSEIEQFREHTKEAIDKAVIEYKADKSKLDIFYQSFEDAKFKSSTYEAAMTDPTATIKSISEAQKVINDIEDIEKQIESLTTSAKYLLEKSKNALTEPNPYSDTVKTAEERVQTTKDTIDELESINAELAASLEIAKTVVKVFSPSGVRAHIIDTVTPFLNERTSDYLSALSDGNINAVWTTLTRNANGELREKFNIEVTHDKGGKSYKSISGGEKRKVRLATMLALQDLVASRASKPISLWMGDEIDDALDEAGLERLMGILDRKAKERGTVLIVSHNSLTDWCDNILTVRKENGYSTIEGSLCEELV